MERNAIRKYFLMLIVMAVALPLRAQFQAESRQRKADRPIGVGLKVGANLPNYFYSSNDLDGLGRDSVLMNRIHPMFGVQVEIPVTEDLVFTPELVYATRGDKRQFKNVPSGQTLNYEAKVHYLDLRLPVSYVLPLRSPIQPFIFAGVDASMVMPYIRLDSVHGINLSGTITQASDEVEVNKSNMAPFDVSVFAGLGFRFTMNFGDFSLVAKLEADYNYGLLNTYSKQEIASQVAAANLGVGGTHYIVNSRKNRGFEAYLTIILPLRFMSDACSNWSDEVYPSRSSGHRGF